MHMVAKKRLKSIDASYPKIQLAWLTIKAKS